MDSDKRVIDVDLGQYKKAADVLICYAMMDRKDDMERAVHEAKAAKAINTLLRHLEFWLNQYKEMQEENKRQRAALVEVSAWWGRFYPPDVYTGESGDYGAREVVRIRGLIKEALSVMKGGALIDTD